MENNYNGEYAIEMKHITLSFARKIANDDVTLQLRKGEVHALLGENGAGKSTLMNVLFGLYKADSGEIYVNGKKEVIDNAVTANKLGIGMVHQHFKLVHNFSILENIVLGVEETHAGILKLADARKKVVELCNKYHFDLDPDAKIEDITVGMQQRTEILKMLFRNNNIMIFDEPTAVLTPQEIREFMTIVKNLKAEGKSILFISHKLDEIKEVADRCTILRKGKCIATVDVASVSKEELSEMMVGRKVNLKVDKAPAKVGNVVLEVRNLSVAGERGHKDKVNNVSFDVRAGEIVCIAGIDGNGQSELIKGITGTKPLKSGTVKIDGQDFTHKSIRYKNTHGISHIPEDRHRDGLILDYDMEKNMVLQEYFESRFSHSGFLKGKEIAQYTDELIDEYDIRSMSGGTSIVRNMSGGNQQKIIIAREMTKQHKLMIAVQPTRGLDVGAIEYIHKSIVKQRDMGIGVLLVSFELEEVMNLADRILVMFEGEIVGEFTDIQNLDLNELGLYMAGGKRMNLKEVA